MLLRTTFSNTKKFFQKTVESFKYFLSGGYERIPKSSPCSPFPSGGSGIHHQVKYSQTYRELDKVYTDYTSQWDVVGTKQITEGRSKKKESSTKVLPRNDDRVCDNLISYSRISPEKSYQVDQIKENPKKKKIAYDGKRYQKFSSNKVLREERSFLVAKRLKELEMLDNGNMEHVLDIEEVLHYYSRLTCPAYVDIVDKFFTDMYSELLNGHASLSFSNSNPILQRIGFES